MERIPEEVLNSAGAVKPADNLYSRYGKRVLDVLLSAGALILLSPIFCAVAVLELIYHGRPVLYHTLRPGKDAGQFKLYKFRSMTNEKGVDGRLLPDKDRMTRFGRFIRKTSIDELPELFNILKGDMSIIGPRPLLAEYLEYYTPRHACRHKVRPGLACVRVHESPGSTWTWADQFENDIWYIENMSFRTDVLELFAVMKKVFLPEKFRAASTRVPFMGGETLYETRSSKEAGLDSVTFDSTSMDASK